LLSAWNDDGMTLSRSDDFRLLFGVMNAAICSAW
jgi:hypothetical protein